MIQGLGSPRPPETPFAPSGNPVWDEIQQAHSSLSPAAQRAVSMSGVPQRAAEAEVDPAAAPSTEAQPLAPIAAPSAMKARGLGSPTASAAPPAPISAAPASTPEATAHLGELNRVTAPPLPSSSPLAHTKADTGRSGIGQIHNKWIRGLASVGDAIGSAVLPNLTSLIPGTELHHRDVVAQNEGIVNADTTRAKSKADEAEAIARSGSLAHPSKEWKQGSEPEIDPDHPELGPQSVFYNATDPTQKHFGGAPVAAKPTTAEWAQGGEPEIDPAHPDLGPQAVWYNKQDPKQKRFGGASVAAKPVNTPPHYQHIPGVGVVAITPGKDGKIGAEIAYKEDPNIETELTDLQINGKPHKVIVAKHTGSVVKDLGESGIKPPTVNVNAETNRSDRSYDKRNAELTAIGKPVSDLYSRFGRLQETIAQGTPQADALVAPELLTVMAGGAGSGLRMNESEIARIIGGRSKWETLRASIQQWSLDPSKANSITPEQRQQIRALAGAVGEKLARKQKILTGAYTALTNTDDEKEHRRIVNEARENFSKIDEETGGGAVPEVKTQAEYDALPSGAKFTQNGQSRRKP